MQLATPVDSMVHEGLKFLYNASPYTYVSISVIYPVHSQHAGRITVVLDAIKCTDYRVILV